VASEAYDDMPAALAEYRSHVESAVASLPVNSPALAGLACEAGELMEWALKVLRTARTRNCDHLDSISAALRYISPVFPSGTLKVDG